MMDDYVYVVTYSDVEEGGNITEPIVAYQYEEDALAYIEHERAIDPRLAQYLYVEKVIFRV
jgi:hypothetical protein